VLEQAVDLAQLPAWQLAIHVGSQKLVVTLGKHGF
jgi:hypothetical protein